MLTYSELISFPTYEDRLDYLRGHPSAPAELSFGSLRDLNQKFYNSRAWKEVRDYVVARDLGYDLAIPGRHILGRVIVHHMNPLKPKDLYAGDGIALDPEFLITVSHETHLGIHFEHIPTSPILVERRKGDTKLW